MELAFLSAVEQARLVRGGEVTSTQLVELYLERIARIDPSLNAFVTVADEHALATARERDSSPSDAPFHGVPIAVKDLAATAEIRTTYSSRAYADYVPDFDTAVVRRIREAGFVIVGKTNTPEFGTVAFTESELNGATCNPWNLELTPGGSIRIPASCCGLFGLKPSRGRVSSEPNGALETRPPGRWRDPWRTPRTSSMSSPATSRETRGGHRPPSGRLPRPHRILPHV
jgi:amidase